MISFVGIFSCESSIGAASLRLKLLKISFFIDEGCGDLSGERVGEPTSVGISSSGVPLSFDRGLPPLCFELGLPPFCFDRGETVFFAFALTTGLKSGVELSSMGIIFAPFDQIY